MNRTVMSDDADPWVHLNVGGRLFSTRRSTLVWPRDSYFEKVLLCSEDRFAQPELDAEGRIMIDRDPRLFEHILEFLRSRRLYEGTDMDRLRDESRFYLLEQHMFPEHCGDDVDRDEWLEHEYEPHGEITSSRHLSSSKNFRLSPVEVLRLVSSRGCGCITVNGYTLLDTNVHQYYNSEEGYWSAEMDFPLHFSVKGRDVSVRVAANDDRGMTLRYCRLVRFKKSQLTRVIPIDGEEQQPTNRDGPSVPREDSSA